jgi:hypothetical protein
MLENATFGWIVVATLAALFLLACLPRTRRHGHGPYEQRR